MQDKITDTTEIISLNNVVSFCRDVIFHSHWKFKIHHQPKENRNYKFTFTLCFKNRKFELLIIYNDTMHQGILNSEIDAMGMMKQHEIYINFIHPSI